MCHPERSEGSRGILGFFTEPALLARRSLGVGGSEVEGLRMTKRKRREKCKFPCST